MSESIEPIGAGKWTEDDLKGNDIHPHAPGDDETGRPEDGRPEDGER